MNNLSALITELCPNGVEYKELQAVLKIKNGSDYKSFGEGDIPVYGSGGIIAHTNRFAYDKPSVLIPRKGSVDKLYYVDVPFWNVDTIFYTEINTGLVIPRYVYHCLLREHLEKLNTAGGVPSLTQNVLNKVKIPVPPLEVQHEIVRILDTFTELTARQKQYEYYRDMLLSFGENGGGETGNNINFFLVAEIADTNIGLATTVTKYKANQGVLLIHNSDIQENEIVLKQHEYITEAFAEKNHKKRLQENDVITVHTGDVGTSAVISKEYAGAIGFTTITSRIRNPQKVLPEYFCHYLNSHRCKAEIASMTISDRSNLNQNCFEKLRIPIPPIDEQRRIVTILDHFSTLCTDLTSGLPAEIEARQKQYEYYRDNLLSFTPAD